MNKVTIWIAVLSMIIMGSPALALANTPPRASKVTGPARPVSAEEICLMSRLDEIKNMNRSAMTPTVKQALRQEVRQIKQEIRKLGGGIYLSAGAVIVIVLLLVLLL